VSYLPGALYISDGVPARHALLGTIQDLAIDAVGNLVVPSQEENKIRVVAEQTGTFYGQAMTAGHVYTVAGDGREGYSGDGGPATAAELDQPSGVATDAAGNLVVADPFN
jgi:hypothetical protein